MTIGNFFRSLKDSYFFFPLGGSWFNIAFFFASFSRSAAFFCSFCVFLFFLLILLIFQHYKQTSNVSPSKMLPFLVRTFHLSRNQKSVLIQFLSKSLWDNAALLIGYLVEVWKFCRLRLCFADAFMKKTNGCWSELKNARGIIRNGTEK